MNRRGALWLFSGCGVLIIICFGLLSLHSKGQGIIEFTFYYSLAFLAFALAAYWVCRRTTADSGAFLLIIMLFALLFRLVSLPGAPIFEDDPYRYMWDGKVWSAGINPYFYPPDHIMLEELRDENWKPINFKHISTIYPPVAQGIFRIAHYLFPGSLTGLKTVLLLFDLGTIAVLVWLLHALGLPRIRVLLYAWNPLVIKEYANSGHIDVAALFFLMLFFTLSIKRQKSLAAVALGLSILVKLFPLVLLPALIFHFRFRHFIVCGLVIALGYVPFLDAGELLFEGLGVYAAQWEFNDSGFVILHFLLGLFLERPDRAAKALIMAGIFLTGILLSRRVTDSPLELFRISAILIGGLLIFGPTVDPWYITWIIPFLAILPRASWILLTGTAFFSYWYYWKMQDLWWIRLVEYVPFYAVLVTEKFFELRGRVGVSQD